VLDALDQATSPEQLNIPGWRLHPLTGDRKGIWSISVSGNWRITFEFSGTDAVNINLEDYH
jgi:proteic killer suppression protein